MKGKGQAPATIWSHPAARLIRSLTIENNKSGADPLVSLLRARKALVAARRSQSQ